MGIGLVPVLESRIAGVDPYDIEGKALAAAWPAIDDLASEFGGGGHSQAAGAVVDGALDEVIAKVIRRAQEYIKRFS